MGFVELNGKIMGAKDGAVQYDETQLAVIQCDDRCVVAEAKAGAGKTTTAVGAAQYRRNDSWLYICLNKSVQLEAQARFPVNVECRTTHSLAFGAVGRKFGDRVSNRWGPRLLADELNIGNMRVAAMACKALGVFFGSEDQKPSMAHVQEIAHGWVGSDHEKGLAMDAMQLAWQRMQTLADRTSMPHDAYLKMWAVSKPDLRKDRIILDEAQDTNPVTKQVILAQGRKKLLLLGDRHQGIYLFRGSKNVMEEFSQTGATVLQMPRTWRFGARTATIANTILSKLKGETTAIVGLGQDAPYQKGQPYAVLTRTNAALFGFAAQCRGRGVHWVGGIENYRIELVLDAYYLFSLQANKMRDAVMRRYYSWTKYVEDAESTKDGEARILIALVNQYGHEIPQLVEELKTNAVIDRSAAKFILTTAHKAKGLEFDFVRIGDDFECLVEAEEELDAMGCLTPETAQEINLLYVAVTRARKFVRLNEETTNWLKSHGVNLEDM